MHKAVDSMFSDVSVSPYNDQIESMRGEEYPMLKDNIYLDHGGTTLYAKSLVQAFSHDLLTHLYGNPHSDSAPSALAGRQVEEVRGRALSFFNADPKHFDLIFVSNATAAIKLVAECFRDLSHTTNGKRGKGFWYGYHRDSHTSLVGVRELTNGLHHCFRNDEEVYGWINDMQNSAEIKLGTRRAHVGLFAFPGQSNMTGRRLPLTWPAQIRENNGARIYTLLDAAALATTYPVDLGDESAAPDFTCVSFYKIFGFPNIGALIVRKDAGDMLRKRRYFGGGTVDMVISLGNTWHKKKDTALHDELEEGTLPFHSIFALGHALDTHKRLFGSMAQISEHTAFLAKSLYDGLSELRHDNGLLLCRIYKDPSAVYGNPKSQGATIAFNVQGSDGTMIPYNQIEQAANDQGLYLRSGSLCNPGGVATYLEFTAADLRAAFAAGHRCSAPIVSVLGKSTGVVRASLGAMSTISDVDNFLRFLRKSYVNHTSTVDLLSSNVKSSIESSATESLTMHKMGSFGALRPRWARSITRVFSARRAQVH